VAYAVLIAAFIEAGTLADQYLLKSAFVSALPEWGQVAITFISNNFVVLFLVALLFYLAFELRVIEKILSFLVGLVPVWRQSLEWANAQWQIEADSDSAPILASSRASLEQWASTLIEELTSTPRSLSLALRPANLSDNNAANVLYFGHVIEEYCSEKRSQFFAWTVFYQALANVAETQRAPFSPERIRTLPAQTSFFSLLLSANVDLDQANQIPNDAGLENAVEKALRSLQTLWSGDAGNMTRGLLGTDYGRVLRASTHFLQIEGMRRQFGKLFVMWTVKPGATHPDVFRIPFNTGMFLKYIDTGVMLTQGQRFNSRSEPVSICFEATEREIVKLAFCLLTETKDPTRAAWRQAELADVKRRNLNWTWWIYYRVDTQAYAIAREYKSTSWKRSGNEVVASKT
jgi:hypothetical protein